MHSSIVFIIVVYSLINLSYALELLKDAKLESRNDENNEVWRILGKDESVSRGSHVRINLSTGERMIKVKGKDEPVAKTSVITVDNEKLIEDFNHKSNYYELKEYYDDLKTSLKTELQIMDELLQRYKDQEEKGLSPSKLLDNQIPVLTELEYLLHDIDTAEQFAKIGGISKLIPALNSTFPVLRESVANILGSAMQSNINVQITALESGILEKFLRILVYDELLSVRTKTIFALSCLLRGFPSAQAKFVYEGGLSVLKNIIVFDKLADYKIKLKVLVLISDLVLENYNAKLDYENDINGNGTNVKYQENKERLRQYDQIGILDKLKNEQWCLYFPSLFIDYIFQFMDGIIQEGNLQNESTVNLDNINIEHDVVEKNVNVIYTTFNLCSEEYRDNDKLLQIIKVLRLWYLKLDQYDIERDGYYKKMKNTLDEILNFFKTE